jgi:hypothetical protein
MVVVAGVEAFDWSGANMVVIVVIVVVIFVMTVIVVTVITVMLLVFVNVLITFVVVEFSEVEFEKVVVVVFVEGVGFTSTTKQIKLLCKLFDRN